MIKTAVRSDLPLFGEEFRATFHGAISDRSGSEVDDYSLALKQHSCFQASHVKRLSRESTLPSALLLHLDLYQILRGIDASYWPRGLRRKVQGMADGTDNLPKCSFEDLLKPHQKDRMMQAFFAKNCSNGSTASPWPRCIAASSAMPLSWRRANVVPAANG